MKNKLFTLLIFLLVVVGLSGCIKQTEKKEIIPMEILSRKKVVIIIAKQGFQDIEYHDTKNALEADGIEITTASSSAGQATDKLGRKVAVDKTLQELKIEDFDAVVFIGGSGALEYIESALAHQLAHKAVEKEKILGAICIAPTILAKAGVLEGKKATVWSDPMTQAPIQVLQDGGAEYVDQAVVVDDKIVTANGPSAASEFGQKIVEMLGQ